MIPPTWGLEITEADGNRYIQLYSENGERRIVRRVAENICQIETQLLIYGQWELVHTEPIEKAEAYAAVRLLQSHWSKPDGA